MKTPIDTAIHHQIGRFRSLPELLHLTDRLFQKDPKLSAQLSRLLSQLNVQDQILETRRFVIDTIYEAVSPNSPTKFNLPRKKENYFSFCDLLLFMANDSAKVWHCFQLHDLDPDIHGQLDGLGASVPLPKLRKSFKKNVLKVKPHFTLSIQMDIRVDQDMRNFVYFRLASASGNQRCPEKTEQKLCFRKPTYMVYVPCEPYFYCNLSRPDPVLCQAMADTLRCSSYSSLNISGKGLCAVRQKILLDSRDSDQANRGVDEPLESEASSLPEALPFSPGNAVILSSSDRFQTGDPQLTLDCCLSCSIRFEGSDVLSFLADQSRRGILFPEDSPPSWLDGVLSSRGKGAHKINID